MLSMWKEGKKDSAAIMADFPKDDVVASETLAKILRIWGRHAFDLDICDAESSNREFERWARHVLFGTPLAGNASEPQAIEDQHRHWVDLSRFVNRRRQQEKSYVVKELHDLREVIQVLTHALSQTLVQEMEADRCLLSCFGDLQGATESQSLEETKREVFTLTEKLRKLVESRTDQQGIRMEKLGTKLQEVEAELLNAQKPIALDSFTQLFNREALEQHMERVGVWSVISGSPSCLMMLDIDHLTTINDSYGHRTGDALIRRLADRIVLTFPRKTDCVARYAGGKFAVLLQGDPLEVAQMLGERVLSSVRQTRFHHEDQDIWVTVSIGLAECLPGECPENWVERSDQALHQAKVNGRNQLCTAG